MAGFDHGTFVPHQDEGAGSSQRGTRYGRVLFLVYLLLYGGYVGITAFAPAMMRRTPLVGINLSVLYGLGLIAAALAMAVVNHQVKAAQLCLEAGADANRFMPVHAHSTPLHHAALHGDLEIMKVLVAAGARTDAVDTLWRGTPLGWAIHGKQAAAEAYLRSLGRN